MIIYCLLLFSNWLNSRSNIFSFYIRKSFTETSYFSQMFYFSSALQAKFIKSVIKMQTKLVSEITRHFSFVES